MANIDFPAGLRAINNGKAGTAPQVNPYTLKASTAVYEGEPMAMNTTGQVVGWTATPTTALRFVGAAVHPLTSSTTTQSLLIYDDPDQLYEIQMDDNTVTGPGGFVGANFSFVNTTGGNTTTLQSIAELDGSTATSGHTTTVCSPLQGIRVSTDPENDITLANARVIVKIHPLYHLFASEQAGIA